MLRYQRAGNKFAMGFSMKDASPHLDPPQRLSTRSSLVPGAGWALAGAVALPSRGVLGCGVSGIEQTPAVPSVGNQGGVKIALILPLSAGGQTAVAANSLKNAGELAIAEANAPNVQLIVKDDKGHFRWRHGGRPGSDQ